MNKITSSTFFLDYSQHFEIPHSTVRTQNIAHNSAFDGMFDTTIVNHEHWFFFCSWSLKNHTWIYQPKNSKCCDSIAKNTCTWKTNLLSCEKCYGNAYYHPYRTSESIHRTLKLAAPNIFEKYDRRAFQYTYSNTYILFHEYTYYIHHICL